MNEEQSLSDWESVHDDRSNKAKHQDDEHHENSVPPVFLELPPDLCSARSIPGALPYDQSSSISSFSVVGKIGQLELKSDHSVTSSKDLPDESSEFSQIPSSQFSASASGWSVISSTTSLASNFDMLMSLSGETIKRCKRCKYHNPPGCTICASCDFPLAANPCPSLDEQVALSLQQKYENEALSLLQHAERKRSHLCEESLFEQAKLLANDVRTYCNQQEFVGFEFFSEFDFTFLAASFINQALQLKNPIVSLAYKFTSVQEVDAIRSNGFALDGGQYGQIAAAEVGVDLATALEEWNVRGMKRRGTSLHSIPEHRHPAEMERFESHGWIVVIVESANDFDSNALFSPKTAGITKRFENRSQILPLVYVSSHFQQSLLLERLSCGLSRICVDYFGFGLKMGTANMPPPPAKKAKADRTDTGKRLYAAPKSPSPSQKLMIQPANNPQDPGNGVDVPPKPPPRQQSPDFICKAFDRSDISPPKPSQRPHSESPQCPKQDLVTDMKKDKSPECLAATSARKDQEYQDGGVVVDDAIPVYENNWKPSKPDVSDQIAPLQVSYMVPNPLHPQPRMTHNLITELSKRGVYGKSPKPFVRVAFHPKGIVAASVTGNFFDCSIHIWNSETEERLAYMFFSKTISPITCLEFSPHGDWLATGSLDGTIEFHVGFPGSSGPRNDAKITLQHSEVSHGYKGSVVCFAFSPDSKYFISGHNGGVIKLWNTSSMRCSHSVTVDIFSNSGISDIAFDPLGKSFFASSSEQVVELKIKEDNCLRQLGHCPLLGPSFRTVVGGQYIARVKSGEQICNEIWVSRLGMDPSEKTAMKGHSGGILVLKLSPDGNHLASGSDDGTIRIWNALNGYCESILGTPGGCKRIVSLAWSGNSALVSGTESGTLQIWKAIL